MITARLKETTDSERLVAILRIQIVESQSLNFKEIFDENMQTVENSRSHRFLPSPIGDVPSNYMNPDNHSINPVNSSNLDLINYIYVMINFNSVSIISPMQVDCCFIILIKDRTKLILKTFNEMLSSNCNKTP